jgi:hypothetical protein
MPPQENRQRVLTKIASLNASDGGNWVELQGFNALTTVFYQANGSVVFNPNYGFPIKAFLNQVSGEIKVFDARNFL